MASLLGWLGNGVKRLENTVNNDVVKPIQRDVVRPVQGAVAQVNPADNNRTYNTVAQHGASYAPAPPRSVASQIYHSAPVHGLVSADKFIANNTGLTDLAKATGIIPTPNNQKVQSVKNLATGAVKFPIQAGQQLANTGLQATHTIPNDVRGTAPSLQHQYQQIKKTNGTLPAVLQTGFSAVSDVGPLLGAGKLGAEPAKAVVNAAKPQIDPELLQERNKWVATHANAKDSAIKNFAGQRIDAIDNKIALAREGGYAKIPGKVNKPNVSEVYRGGGEGSMPKGMTAHDVVNYEKNDLGNADVKPVAGVDLKSIPTERLQWVTETPRAAKEYGKVTPVNLDGYKVVAKDGQGGLLIDKSPVTQPTQAANPTNLSSKTGAIEPPRVVIRPPQAPIQNEGVLNASKTSQIPNTRNIQPARLPAAIQRNKTGISQAGDSLPNNTPLTPGTQERGFTQSLKQSANYSKDLKKAVDSSYNPNTDKQTIANTQAFMKQGIEPAHNDVLHRIQSNARPDKQLVNDAGTVMQVLDSQGETAKAQHIHDLLSEHLTNSGQVSQAASLLLRRSPDGIYHKAVSDLKKAGIDVTPSIDDQLKAHREAIRATAPDTLERNVAIQHMKQFVTKNIPTSKLNNIFAFWRAGLLTGPRTVGKILTSHGVHAPFEKLKDVPASMIDRTIGLLRKDNRRSLVFTTQGKAGFKQGAKAGFGKQGYLRTGIDIQPGNNSIEFHNNANYGSSVPGKIAQAYVDGIGRLHGSLYKPFFGYGHLNSLYSLAKAESKNAGLKGSAAVAFQQDFVRTPPSWAQDIAKNDAENLTFQQETQLGKFASAIQSHGGIVGKVIAPFTRIPSAIATDLFNYSPVGGMKAIADGIKAARSEEGWSIADQRKFSQGLGRSIVGTAAVVPGYILYQKGMMNLAYPTDPKEQKLWALQGRTADSVLIGGKWRALGSLGPLGAVLSIGGYLGESQQKGESASQSALNALAGGLKTIESQPYVSGISGATNAIQDPGRYLTSLEKQYAGSIVPTGVAQSASSFDNQSRQINGPSDAIKSKIPGVRQSLAPKTDSFGQTIPAGETGPGALIDPFYSSNQRPSNPVINEVQRLQNTGQGVLPSTQPVKNTFDGVKTTLSKPQAQQLGAKVGQTTQTLWNQTINFDGYKNLPDDQKHQMLANILSDTTSATKAQYAADNNLGQYSPGFSGKAKPLTTKQQAIVDNKFDPSAYLPKESTGTVKAKTPKATKTKSAKTGRKSTGAPRTSLASYLKTVRSTNPKPIKTAKAPSFKSKTPKFKSVSLAHYKMSKAGKVHLSRSNTV